MDVQMIKNIWFLLGILLLTGCLSACSMYPVSDYRYGTRNNPGIPSPYFQTHAKISRDENQQFQLTNFCTSRNNHVSVIYTGHSKRTLAKYRSEYLNLIAEVEAAHKNVACEEVQRSQGSPWDSLYVNFRGTEIFMGSPTDLGASHELGARYISVPEKCYASPNECLRKNEFLEFNDELGHEGFFINYKKALGALDEAFNNVPIEEYRVKATEVFRLDEEYVEVANAAVERLSEIDRISNAYHAKEEEKKKKKRQALELRETKENERKRKQAQKSLFKTLSKNKKELGDQVCTPQNDFGYVERLSGVKIQIRVKGSALDQKDYLFFTPESISYSYVNKDNIIWDQGSSWAACSFTR
jgi:uncharacterized protein YdaU (DUF1376 family)